MPSALAELHVQWSRQVLMRGEDYRLRCLDLGHVPGCASFKIGPAAAAAIRRRRRRLPTAPRSSEDQRSRRSSQRWCTGRRMPARCNGSLHAPTHAAGERRCHCRCARQRYQTIAAHLPHLTFREQRDLENERLLEHEIRLSITEEVNRHPPTRLCLLRFISFSKELETTLSGINLAEGRALGANVLSQEFAKVLWRT